MSAIVTELSLENTLKIFEILAIIGGGAIVLIKMSGWTSKMQSSIDTHRADIRELKDNMKQMTKIMETQAITTTRLDHHEQMIMELKSERRAAAGV